MGNRKTYYDCEGLVKYDQGQRKVRIHRETHTRENYLKQGQFRKIEKYVARLRGKKREIWGGAQYRESLKQRRR